jgi:15-cis-phytoene synthase
MQIMSPSAMTPTLGRSYGYCEKLARREAGNFYPAFRLLPAPQRRAMCALYAFLRIADDIGDGPGKSDEKAEHLDAWQRALEQAVAGVDSHALHPALRHTISKYGIPLEYLTAVVDGIRMDLADVRYDTFDDLYPYCYRVASAVGLACIHIWGFSDDRAKRYAESAGIAFQLTNILRDLSEDAARQRVYLPRCELEQFGYPVEQLMRSERTAAFQAMMQFQVARANRYYDEALQLTPLLSATGQAVFLVLLRTYRGLLDEIARRDYDVFSKRVSLSRWWKLGILLRTLPVRWGLA